MSFPGITLSPQELALKSPAQLEQYYEEHRQVAYGHGYKVGPDGKPIERGIGAPGHETSNHWEALRKREQQGLEPQGTTDRLMAEAKARRVAAAAGRAT